MNDSAELRKRVLDWLASQGFPLEMEVARAFQIHNFRVTSSDSYQDFDEGTTREIDVTASRHSDIGYPVLFEVGCRIECKLAGDKPWMLFVNKAKPDVLLHENFISSKMARSFFLDLHYKKTQMNTIYKSPLIRPEYVGHGLTQVSFSDKSADVPYKATMSAIKSSVARVIELDQIKGDSSAVCGVIFPTIVIGGMLFECFLDSDSNVQLEQVNSGVLHWKGNTPVHASPFVHIVTKAALEPFISEFDKLAGTLISLAENGMDDLKRIAFG